MDDALDLSILDSGMPGYAVALARARPDLAPEWIPFGEELQKLIDFRKRIEDAIYGNRVRRRRRSSSTSAISSSIS